MKKFEFTGETKVLFNGVVLNRIRALVEIKFAWGTINIGDLGGWIEKESNLSSEGNAWVSGDAWVFGNAWVSGNARVSGNAWVSGNARVSGNAWVSGNARVFGDAEVLKSTHYLVMGPMGSRNAFTTFFRNKYEKINVSCGCFFGTIDEFLKKVKKTHGDSKHAKVYRAAVTVALAQIEDIKEELYDTKRIP